MESHALPRTAQDARRIGAKRYFTGKPCRHGHFAEKYTADQSCCVCKSEVQAIPSRRVRSAAQRRAKRAANPEPLRASSRKWKRENPDKVREQSRRARERDPEKQRAHTRKWSTRHRGQLAAYSRRYARAHPAKIAASAAKRRARISRATPPWADQRKIQSVYLDAARLTKLFGFAWEVDHIFPIKGRDGSRGLHVHENLHAIPYWLNRAKNNRAPI
jgi:hypothetical protein